MDYKKFLIPIRENGCACANCGRKLRPIDLVADCADCGAIFCQTCVEEGVLQSHQCEEDEEEFF